MRAVDPRARVSYAELERWPDDGRRHELYGGEAVVVPAPFGRHQRVVTELVSLLASHAQVYGGLVLCSPIDLVLSAYDVVQPDVVWFGKGRLHLLDLDAAIAIVPDLAIEVVSHSTEARDRGRKKDLLGRYGLPEYWIVDPVRHRVEIYTNTAGALRLASSYAIADDITSPALPHLRATAGQLFADISLR